MVAGVACYGRGRTVSEGDYRDEERRARLAQLQALGEKAYDSMYDAQPFRGAEVFYSEAKEYFHDAIRLAGELGLTTEADALRARLVHIQAVYRSQFAR